MAEYTVLSAVHKKAVDGRNGPMQVINLRLSDGTNEHDAEWFTKASTDVPLPNARLEGTLEPTDYGLKFKKAFSGGGGGGFGGRPRDPKDTAAIVRQHSQHMAVLLLGAKASAGLLDATELTPAKIKMLADFFDDDVAAGVERKHPSQQMAKGLPVRNEPQRTGAPEPTTPTADYAQPPGEHPDAGDVPWEQSA